MAVSCAEFAMTVTITSRLVTILQPPQVWKNVKLQNIFHLTVKVQQTTVKQ